MIDIAKIAEVVNRMHLPSGLGDRENACSIAAEAAAQAAAGAAGAAAWAQIDPCGLLSRLIQVGA